MYVRTYIPLVWLYSIYGLILCIRVSVFSIVKFHVIVYVCTHVHTVPTSAMAVVAIDYVWLDPLCLCVCIFNSDFPCDSVCMYTCTSGMAIVAVHFRHTSPPLTR